MIMKNHRSGNAYKNLKPINPGSLYSQSTSANFSDIPHGQRKDFPSIKKKKKFLQESTTVMKGIRQKMRSH